MPTSQDNKVLHKCYQLLKLYCFNYDDTLHLFQAKVFYITVKFVHVLVPLKYR